MEETIPMCQWSKDHWKLFEYVRECCEESNGRVDPLKLRAEGDRYPTVIKGWSLFVRDHSDFDCLDDFYTEGLLLYKPDPLSLWVKLSAKGWKYAMALRGHLGMGGTHSNFEPREKKDDV